VLGKHKIFVLWALGIVAISILPGLLAYFLLFGGREAQRDYAWLARQDENPQGFVLLEPQGVYHIGDVIKIRFGVIYDPRVWEVSHDVFEGAFPLPSDFELQSRKIHETKVQALYVVETELTTQCVTCRDVIHYVNFDLHNSLRARNKVTNEVTAFPWYDSPVKIRFVPVTDASYTPDESALVLLPRAERNKLAPSLIIGGGSALIALLALMSVYVARMRRVPQGTEQYDSPYLVRLQALKGELEEGDACSVANSLYTLLLLLGEEQGYGKVELQDINKQLEDCYSKEGIAKEVVAEVIERLLRSQGEV
jgi:hypothetical protein